jgi:IS5 family transposase
MVGVLMLKYLYNLGDERIPEYWVRDVYFQYFCGGVFLSINFPVIRVTLCIFAGRIGELGFQKIFAYSVHLHGKDGVKQSKFVLSDTSVQGNFTTFPTDAKMCGKVIDKCNKIAEKEGITQLCKYKKERKELLRQTYNGKHPKRAKAAKKAKKAIENDCQCTVEGTGTQDDGRTKDILQRSAGTLQTCSQSAEERQNKV